MRVKENERTAEAIKAIRRYDAALEMVANTSEDIKAVYDTLTSPRSSRTDGMPRTPNPQAGENALCNGLDLINSMQERYVETRIFLLWFEPMWKVLSDSERDVLATYKYSERFSGEMERYAQDNFLSVRQAHRLRRKALEHLILLLFGCL
jgi:hypothetical protein